VLGEPTRVLFVDDEPSIRVTLPAILNQKGFEVTTGATVTEALKAIHSQEFDALIADLNIGEPGDGFTIVSAMRRTQPKCVNFILTGYPAFESALQAIRNQVDDFLVKPADIGKLVESLRIKLKTPREVRSMQTHELASFLREHTNEIVERALAIMKSHPRLSTIPLSDHQRVDHVPGIVAEIIRQLESQKADEPTEAALKAGAEHGQTRKRQGYSQLTLVDDTRALDSAIYEVLQDNLLAVNLSNLIPDLSRLNDSIEAHLQEALKAFVTEQRAA